MEGLLIAGWVAGALELLANVLGFAAALTAARRGAGAPSWLMLACAGLTLLSVLGLAGVGGLSAVSVLEAEQASSWMIGLTLLKPFAWLGFFLGLLWLITSRLTAAELSSPAKKPTPEEA